MAFLLSGGGASAPETAPWLPSPDLFLAIDETTGGGSGNGRALCALSRPGVAVRVVRLMGRVGCALVLRTEREEHDLGVEPLDDA